MRKLIAIGTLLVILTVFVSAASATLMCGGKPCGSAPSQPGSIKLPTTAPPGSNVLYSGSTTGGSTYTSGCDGISQTTTIAGQYSADSGFSQTTSSSGVDFPGMTSGGTSGGSSFSAPV